MRVEMHWLLDRSRRVLEIVLKGAALVAQAKKDQAMAIPVEVKNPELAAKA
jgi:hypothetical protein